MSKRIKREVAHVIATHTQAWTVPMQTLGRTRTKMARPASEDTIEQEVDAQEYTVANPVTKKGKKFVCIGRTKVTPMIDYITTLFDAAGVPKLLIEVVPTKATIRVKIEEEDDDSSTDDEA